MALRFVAAYRLSGRHERRALQGRGCGAVDASLLASTLLRPATTLWTLDKRLAALAKELGCGDRAA